MIERLKEKWLLGVLTIILYSVAVSKIASVFDVEYMAPIWFFIGGLVIVAVVVPYVSIRLLFYVPVYLMCLYSLSFDGYIYSFSFFLTDWLRSLMMFVTQGATEHYSLIMISVILFVVILLVEWQITTETITPQMLFFVGYLLLLNEFNDLSVDWTILIIISIYLLERIAICNEKPLQSNFFVGMVLVMLIMVASLVTQSTHIKSTLISASTSLRQQLDEKGLYEFINNQKFRFMATTGFSEDDSLLGGPIKDDDSLVFHVTQKTPRYWRVDTKATYTGKGWENSDKDTLLENPTPSLSIAPEGYRGLYTPAEEVTMHFYYRDTYLPLTYGKITIPRDQGNILFKYTDSSQRVNMNRTPDYQDISMEIAAPIFEENALKQANLVVPDETYIQLPKDFPKRIQELTLEVTEGKKTLYDKVKAVETFLKLSSDYSYSKSGARHTPKNADYVEFFLFESKVGYCDNFSTAMSVMLRSIGIPTRWAKGFSQGQVREKTENESIYNIRNSDAHSWVEVYFEDSGWVPFEPTPSFTGTERSEAQVPQEDTIPSSSESENKNSNSSSQESTEQSEDKASSNQKITLLEKVTSFFKENQNILKLMIRLIMLLFLMVCVILLIKYRNYIALLIATKILGWQLSKVYPLLLKQLERKIPRESSQSLDSYTKQISITIPKIGKSFSELTTEYEAIVYGTKEDSNQFNKVLTLSKAITDYKKTNT